ncbi:DUF397 domain-containing protein [Actinomadura harenae]|uniref:DUF397 domain-containing protein n=1 Tax=Actinomadura harenae TaxID=2483351 RepID=A0A3M2M9G8_9ACTN|nr:DUF397 domain-containing protein [Actinomadura harenae]RMI43788.1 DUF397 domain-containing protein [Actinomadura harenae]
MTPNWRKSSHSHDSNSDCVELARLPTGLGIRDSKASQAGHLVLPRSEFATLLAGLKQEMRSHSST